MGSRNLRRDGSILNRFDKPDVQSRLRGAARFDRMVTSTGLDARRAPGEPREARGRRSLATPDVGDDPWRGPQPKISPSRVTHATPEHTQPKSRPGAGARQGQMRREGAAMVAKTPQELARPAGPSAEGGGGSGGGSTRAVTSRHRGRALRIVTVEIVPREVPPRASRGGRDPMRGGRKRTGVGESRGARATSVCLPAASQVRPRGSEVGQPITGSDEGRRARARVARGAVEPLEGQRRFTCLRVVRTLR